jgi:predicted Zn-dependent protease
MNNAIKRAEKIFDKIKNVTNVDYQLDIIQTNEYVWEIKYNERLIQISTKTIREMSDNELAFVLSHEAAHIIKREEHEKQIKEKINTHIDQVSDGFSKLDKFEKNTTKIVLGSLLAVAGIFGAYTKTMSAIREAELDADETAIEIMKDCGFKESAAIKIFNKFINNKNHSLWELISAAHPDTNERIANITKKIESLKN